MDRYDKSLRTLVDSSERAVGSVDVLRAALQIWPVELTSIGMMSLVVWRCLFCCGGLTAAAAVPLIERLCEIPAKPNQAALMLEF